MENPQLARRGIGWKSNLLLALLWITYFLFWIHVYRNTWASDYSNSIAFLTVLMAVYGLLVTIWIGHNVHIYRKKGPRRTVRIVHFDSAEDALRNQIVYRTDPKRTQEIIIDVVNGEKIFFAGLTLQGGLLPLVAKPA